jgi:hypothetical protein
MRKKWGLGRVRERDERETGQKEDLISYKMPIPKTRIQIIKLKSHKINRTLKAD